MAETDERAEWMAAQLLKLSEEYKTTAIVLAELILKLPPEVAGTMPMLTDTLMLTYAVMDMVATSTLPSTRATPEMVVGQMCQTLTTIRETALLTMGGAIVQ